MADISKGRESMVIHITYKDHREVDLEVPPGATTTEVIVEAMTSLKLKEGTFGLVWEHTLLPQDTSLGDLVGWMTPEMLEDLRKAKKPDKDVTCFQTFTMLLVDLP